MARRMFSPDIVQSDAFLDMSASAQALYFHLGMESDDDGFVSGVKRIMTSVGAKHDDVVILAKKKFIIIFEDGVCVIKHHRINNFIRKDIYKKSKYLKHRQSLYIRENGSYSLNSENAIPMPEGHFQVEKLSFPDVNVALTSGQRNVNLGKVRIGKEYSPDGETSPSKEYEEVKLDDNGVPIETQKVSQGKADPTPKRIYEYFVEQAKKELPDVKITQTYPQASRVIKQALAVSSEEELKDVIQLWFEEPPQDRGEHDLARITQALSGYNVSKYQTTYGK